MIRSSASVTTQFLVLLIVILIVNGAGYFLILKSIYSEELKVQAQTVVSNVQSFGAWVARSGRVWTQKSDQDFLSKEAFHPINNENEVTTFFSKNPALATREFSEVVATSNSPAKFRMTSHNVMNPINAPDEFEAQALKEIIGGNLNEFVRDEGEIYRYATPVCHTAACIACHGDPAKAPNDVLEIYGSKNGFGFQEGDVAGIISVSIPRKSLLNTAASKFGAVEIILLILSIFLMTWFVRTRIIKPVSDVTAFAEQLSHGKTIEMDVAGINPRSRNEIDQLYLATSRMNQSYAIVIKKMNEAKAIARKAAAYAKAMKKKNSE